MTEDFRPDPDALLAQLQREEDLQKTGRLYIILGMCPGVGKTYAMMLLARQRQKGGDSWARRNVGAAREPDNPAAKEAQSWRTRAGRVRSGHRDPAAAGSPASR